MQYTFHFVAEGWSFSQAFTVNRDGGDILAAYDFALGQFYKFYREHYDSDISCHPCCAVFYEDPLDFGEPKLYHTFRL